MTASYATGTGACITIKPADSSQAQPGATGAPPRRALGGIDAALRSIMDAPRQMTTEEMNAALAAMRGEK